jgi:tryptophan synthase beta chain
LKAHVEPKSRVSQITLPVDKLPRKWYNILPDLPVKLAPPRDPADGPSTIQLLGKRLVGECLRQENSDQRWIDIPEGIRELYIQAGRPRSLYRAYRLEKKLGLKRFESTTSGETSARRALTK